MFGLPLWALSLLGGIGNFFKALFSFVSKPPGIYIALVAVASLAIWGSGELGYRRGDRIATAACEARHTAAAVAEQARQVQVGAEVTTASETRTGQSQATEARNQEIVNDVKARAHDLPPVPSICPPAVPAALVDRLRRIE